MPQYKPDMFASPDEWEADLIHRLTGRMAADADRQQQFSGDQIAAMEKATEAEIMHSVFPGSEDPNADRLDIDSLSQVTDWDGSPISDQEGLARAIQGDEADPNYLGQRPLAYQHETEMDQENRALRAQNEALRRAQQFGNPQSREQQEANEQAFYEQHGLMAYEPEKARALFGQMNQLEQSRNQIELERINTSMNRAHQEYGRDFEKIYAAVGQMDPSSPLAREIVMNVVRSRDPGEALMELHGNDLISSLGAGRTTTTAPPFMGGRSVRGPVRVSRVQRDEDSFDSGYGDAEVEQDIMDSIWDKRR